MARRLNMHPALLAIAALAMAASAVPAQAQDEDIKPSEEELIARQARERDARRQAWQDRRDRLERDISELRSRVSHIEYEEPAARRTAEQYNSSVNTMRYRYQALQMQLSNCTGDYVYCMNLAGQGQQMYNQLNQMISDANYAINRHNNLVNRLNSANDQLSSRIDELNNMGSMPN